VNTLVVVVEVLLVVVISVKVMMVVVILVVNCGREDGGGDVVSVYNQRSLHNQYDYRGSDSHPVGNFYSLSILSTSSQPTNFHGFAHIPLPVSSRTPSMTSQISVGEYDLHSREYCVW